MFVKATTINQGGQLEIVLRERIMKTTWRINFLEQIGIHTKRKCMQSGHEQ